MLSNKATFCIAQRQRFDWDSIWQFDPWETYVSCTENCGYWSSRRLTFHSVCAVWLRDQEAFKLSYDSRVSEGKPFPGTWKWKCGYSFSSFLQKTSRVPHKQLWSMNTPVEHIQPNRWRVYECLMSWLYSSIQINNCSVDRLKVTVKLCNGRQWKHLTPS